MAVGVLRGRALRRRHVPERETVMGRRRRHDHGDRCGTCGALLVVNTSDDELVDELADDDLVDDWERDERDDL